MEELKGQFRRGPEARPWEDIPMKAMAVQDLEGLGSAQRWKLAEVASDLLTDVLEKQVAQFWQQAQEQQRPEDLEWSCRLNASLSRLLECTGSHEVLFASLCGAWKGFVKSHRLRLAAILCETWTPRFAQELHLHLQHSCQHLHQQSMADLSIDQMERGTQEHQATSDLSPADLLVSLITDESSDELPGGFSQVCVVDSQMEKPQVEATLKELKKAAFSFRRLGRADAWQHALITVALEELGRCVEKLCRSGYSTRGLLDRLAMWFLGPFLCWLRSAYGLGKETSSTASELELKAETDFLLAARYMAQQCLQNFVGARLQEVFLMISNFPDSEPALLDLRRCLVGAGCSAQLVHALHRQFKMKLLIAGTPTRDIIKAYSKTIRALPVLDPRGLLLQVVTGPIRDYLKKRKDTVRCVILALTEDQDLQQELELSANPEGGPELLDCGLGDFEFSEDEEDPDAWQPDPIDALPLGARRRKGMDVFSLLVSIYGSREMFIKEYEEMLADRLLGNLSAKIEKEAQNLELLKGRFGEAALSHCLVMLRDIKESQRVDDNIHSKAGPSGPANVHALVLSQHYWPPVISKGETPSFRLPAMLEEGLAQYEQAYQENCDKRHLQWQRTLGLVEIVVQLADREISVTATPPQVAVLACFSEAEGSPSRSKKQRQSVKEVAVRLEIPEGVVRKRISFWVSKGVLREVSHDVFEVQESTPFSGTLESPRDSDSTALEVPMFPSPIASKAGRGTSAMERQACEAFIRGMLTNYASLPLARIHNFLQMYMTDPVYTQTEAQLREFLSGLCQEGRLECDNQSYSLVR